MVDMAASVAAALRALNGLSPPRASNCGTSLPEDAKAAPLRTTPSHMTGKSDTFESWRRPVNSPQASPTGQSTFAHRRKFSAPDLRSIAVNRSSTTPSHIGTADRAQVWRPLPVSQEGRCKSLSPHRCSSTCSSSPAPEPKQPPASSSSSSGPTRKTTPSARGTADRYESWRHKAELSSGKDPRSANMRLSTTVLQRSINSDMLAQALARATGQTARRPSHDSQRKLALTTALAGWRTNTESAAGSQDVCPASGILSM